MATSKNSNPFMPNGAPVGVPTPNVTPMPTPTGSSSADNFEVDLTSVQGGFTIPDGIYKAKCIEVEQNVSKGGNPMFVWTFQVSEGPNAGFEGKVFTAITPAAMWKVAETVQALGVGQTGEVVKFKRSDVVGKECGIQIEATEYNGQTRSQISKVMSLAELAEARS